MKRSKYLTVTIPMILVVCLALTNFAFFKNRIIPTMLSDYLRTLSSGTSYVSDESPDFIMYISILTMLTIFIQLVGIALSVWTILKNKLKYLLTISVVCFTASIFTLTSLVGVISMLLGTYP